MQWTSSWRRSIQAVPPENDGLPAAGALLDEAPCGLLVTDADGTIRSVNRTFCRWIGREREALVGVRRVQDLLTMGGKIFHQTHWAPLLQLQGSISEVKLDVLHEDGRAIPMVMNAVRRNHGERVLHELALFVAKDRHAYERELMLSRKRAEELLILQTEARNALVLTEARLRIAMDAAKLFVWEVDPATGRSTFHPNVALLLGYGEPAQIDEERFFSAINPADRETLAQVILRAIDSKEAVSSCTYRLAGADGVQRTVLATARAVAHDDGTPHHVVGLLQDITELSAQRAAAEDRALFAEQMIGIFSHDLRNPLSTIKLGAAAMEMSAPAANHLPLLQSIRRATARAQVLIDDLLDFTMARIGRGLSVALKPVDLHALVAAHVEELGSAYPGRKLTHRRRGAGTCDADTNRLFQLVGNLVSIAMHYGDSDSPVTVTSRIDDRNFAIDVHNMGQPIPAAVLPKLFEPMVRGTDAESANRSVGLGLYIVSEIAQAHGGDVRVISSASEGTTFSVTMARRVPTVSSKNSPST
jgi:sigma-B regulation protein RsbU (phosphoserine phosphatase)